MHTPPLVSGHAGRLSFNYALGITGLSRRCRDASHTNSHRPMVSESFGTLCLQDMTVRTIKLLSSYWGIGVLVDKA
jgi:hypothetical protein